MLLRPYQKRLVGRALAALGIHDNTLSIAATGAGKTIMMSGLCGEFGGRQLVLQHRQELVDQNQAKYKKVNPKRSTTRYTADHKSMRADTVFAMQQTLARNLPAIGEFDLCVVDEAHHIVAPTYQHVIDQVLERNPDCKISGWTATPERGDRKSLRKYFSNVSDKITIKELVGLGFLVPPRAFVVDVGVQDQLRQLKPSSNFGDQTEVADILDTVPINDEVVRHWKEHAVDRQTIVFCSTVQHAQDVAKAFRQAGVKAACVNGKMRDAERRQTLEALDNGELQVVTNVAVLTEGYDSQPVSCVILLRQCSEKGPMIQMAGRGLRTVDPELYPGVVKKDCVVLDFGVSILTHGDLDMGDGLMEEVDRESTGEAATKICPEEYSQNSPYKFPDPHGLKGCGTEVPAGVKHCPLCGFEFVRLDGSADVLYVDLTEIDLLNASPFRYVDLWGNDLGLMASGFAAWAGVFSPDHGETWYALGKKNDDKEVHTLAVTGRVQAIAAADDFLRHHETDGSAKKSKRWLNDPASESQIDWLNRFGYGIETDMWGKSGKTKYWASCHMGFKFAQSKIEKAIGV